MGLDRRGIFGFGANTQDRLIRDMTELAKRIEFYRSTEGLSIGLTMGGFDFQHIGHYRYLEAGHKHCDLLIVGVDSDEKLSQRKGPGRPIYPFDERAEMLMHVRHVDIVTVKEAEEPKWHLIKLLHPDVLIATQGTYKPEQIAELESHHCKKVVVLEPQATTSTSAKIRNMHTDFADKTKQEVQGTLSTFEANAKAAVEKLKQELRQQLLTAVDGLVR